MEGENKIINEREKEIIERIREAIVEIEEIDEDEIEIEKEIEKDGIIKYKVELETEIYDGEYDETYYYFITDGNFIIYNFTLNEEINEVFINHSLYYEMLKKLGWENKIKEIEKMFYEEVKKLFAKMKKNEEKIKEYLKNKDLVFEYKVYTDGFKLLVEAIAELDNGKKLRIYSWDDPKEAEEFIDNLPNEYISCDVGKLDHASILLAKWLFQHDKHVEIGDICIPCHLFCKDHGCADGVHCDGSCGVDKNNIKILTVKDFKIALREALEYD